MIEILYKTKLFLLTRSFRDLSETEEYPWKFIKQHDSQGIAISRKSITKIMIQLSCVLKPKKEVFDYGSNTALNIY